MDRRHRSEQEGEEGRLHEDDVTSKKTGEWAKEKKKKEQNGLEVTSHSPFLVIGLQNRMDVLTPWGLQM